MNFPVLQSGAICQYPAKRVLQHSTDVVEFINGGEQRFRHQHAGRRRWLIDLTLLSENEANELEKFFHQHDGQVQSFVFRDPWDMVEYTDCVLSGESLEILVSGQGRANTRLVIEQSVS